LKDRRVGAFLSGILKGGRRVVKLSEGFGSAPVCSWRQEMLNEGE
jgi:hypothetical protein